MSASDTEGMSLASDIELMQRPSAGKGDHTRSGGRDPGLGAGRVGSDDGMLWGLPARSLLWLLGILCGTLLVGSAWAYLAADAAAPLSSAQVSVDAHMRALAQLEHDLAVKLSTMRGSVHTARAKVDRIASVTRRIGWAVRSFDQDAQATDETLADPVESREAGSQVADQQQPAAARTPPKPTVESAPAREDAAPWGQRQSAETDPPAPAPGASAPTPLPGVPVPRVLQPSPPASLSPSFLPPHPTLSASSSIVAGTAAADTGVSEWQPSPTAEAFYKRWYGLQRDRCITAHRGLAALPGTPTPAAAGAPQYPSQGLYSAWNELQERAQRELTAHQFPPRSDCAGKRFLIVQPYRAGIGAMLAVLSAQLATAIAQGRILLLQEKWAYADGCALASGLGCYMQPISSCTLEDAGVHPDDVAVLGCAGESKTCNTKVSELSKVVFDSASSTYVGRAGTDLDCDVVAAPAGANPASLRTTYCSRETTQEGLISRNHIPFDWARAAGLSVHWWRAQSARFMLNPQPAFIPVLEARMLHAFTDAASAVSKAIGDGAAGLVTSTSTSTPPHISPSALQTLLPAFDTGTTTLAVHVRRGDKVREAKPVQLRNYLAKAGDITRLLRPAPLGVFLSTDEPSVISEVTKLNSQLFADAAATMGRQEGGVTVKQRLLDTALSAARSGDMWAAPRHHFIFTANERSSGAQSDLLGGARFGKGQWGSEEALIAWSNLFLSARAGVFIGTSSSNWCMLVDELRLAAGDCSGAFLDVEERYAQQY